jgi:hypothetical protein
MHICICMYTALHSSHFTSLHHTTLNYSTLHLVTPHYTPPHHIITLCYAIHNTALHYTTQLAQKARADKATAFKEAGNAHYKKKEFEEALAQYDLAIEAGMCVCVCCRSFVYTAV